MFVFDPVSRFVNKGKYTGLPKPTHAEIVVEEDIDSSKIDEVLWAIIARTRLERDIHIIPDCHTNNVHPAIHPEEKISEGKQTIITSARVVIDACRDLSWKEEWYPIARMSPELRSRIKEKWEALLADCPISLRENRVERIGRCLKKSLQVAPPRGRYMSTSGTARSSGYAP